MGLDLVTATFGPRYTWQLRHKKISFYGQFLAGEVWGQHSAFPASGGTESSMSDAAWMAGGGANLRLNRYLGWRAVEAKKSLKAEPSLQMSIRPTIAMRSRGTHSDIYPEIMGRHFIPPCP